MLQKLLLLFLLVFSATGFAQHFTVTLDNFMSTSNTFEVDVVLIVDAPAEGVRLCGLSTGINFNPAILNGGTPCTTFSNSGCDSWMLIPGTIAPELTANGGLNTMITGNRANPVGHLRIVQVPKATSLVDLVPGSYKIGRFRFSNTVSWALDSDPELWLSPTNSIPAAGSTNTVVSFSYFGVSSPIMNYTTTILNPSNEPGVALGYTQESPMHRAMNIPLATVSSDATEQIATAFPNPFSNSFKLNLTSVSNELVQVSVYDMLGKLIEDFNVESNGVNSFTFGEKYAAGFYNVKVVQGDLSQVIRMIKQ